MNMETIIDGVILDNSNKEFYEAIQAVSEYDGIIYLTGRAGTGKTTFLKYIKTVFKENTVILAPTGVAAMNAGGQTIHSFFHLPLSIFLPDDSRFKTKREYEGQEIFGDVFHFNDEQINIIKSLKLLIIDEVSMVRCDILDAIDKILRIVRKKKRKLFGGVKLLLIGDVFQLPPIIKNDEWEILNKFYKSPFFFDSTAIRKGGLKYIELVKIYRQSDSQFITLLNHIRTNNLSQEDFNALNLKFDPCFKEDEQYITLSTHNAIVEKINYTKLAALNTPQVEYEAIISGDFPKPFWPTERILTLKVGAKVMFLKNDALGRYYNGSIGTVKELHENNIAIDIPNGNIVQLYMDKWENRVYSWNKTRRSINEDVIGYFCQFPIKLAWAITVHKSQGLTFEKVIADISQSFSPGQVYVALSRCKSLDGLVLKTLIPRHAIKTDPRVIKFTNKYSDNKLEK